MQQTTCRPNMQWPTVQSTTYNTLENDMHLHLPSFHVARHVARRVARRFAWIARCTPRCMDCTLHAALHGLHVARGPRAATTAGAAGRPTAATRPPCAHRARSARLRTRAAAAAAPAAVDARPRKYEACSMLHATGNICSSSSCSALLLLLPVRGM